MNRSRVPAAALIARIILTKTVRKASFSAEELPLPALGGRTCQIVLPKIIANCPDAIVNKKVKAPAVRCANFHHFVACIPTDRAADFRGLAKTQSQKALPDNRPSA